MWKTIRTRRKKKILSQLLSLQISNILNENDESLKKREWCDEISVTLFDGEDIAFTKKIYFELLVKSLKEFF